MRLAYPDSTGRSRQRGRAALTALGLLLPLLAAVLGVVRHLPPAPLDGAAPADRFSAARAMPDIEAIARAPRPIGSAEHRRVREHIAGRLRALGFETEIQQAFAINRKHGVAGPVANVVARKAGSGRGGGGRAILLAAHYDSVPTGPGASDDGAGIAALLEAGRWLGTQPPLKNDVILLASDGEEFGLLGAEAFVAGHRWARAVGLVVNLEARGHAGPAILFETSPMNAALIAGAGGSVRGAVANSLTYEVYKRLPNDTDFTVFKRAGMAGVNIAFLGGVTHYHSALDTPANVDRASLQHHGEYLTGLLRVFGNAALPLPASRDAIYFPAPGDGLVQYAPWLALPLAALGLLLVVGIAAQARRAGELGAWRLVGAMLRVLALLAVAGLAGWGFWTGARWINPNFRWLSNGDGYHTELLLLGLLAMIAAGVLALAGRRPADRVACWLVWALLATATAVALPGASWVFTWPLLAGALAQYAAGHPRAPRAAAWLAPGLGLVPLAFLAAPLIWLLYAALGPAQLPVISGLAALFLLPLTPLLAGTGGRGTTALLLLAGCSLAGAGLAMSGFSVEAKKPNHIVYLLERTPPPTRAAGPATLAAPSLARVSDAAPATPAARARWFTSDEEVDAWTTQFLGTHPARGPVPELGRVRPVLQAAAPILDLPVPRARIVADSTANGERRLTLQVESPANALTLEAGDGNAVRAVHGNGALLFAAADGQPFRRVQIVAPPAAGVEVRFDLAAGAPLQLQLIQQFWGLPDPPPPEYMPRAAQMMTAPLRQADSRYTIDAWTE